MLVFDAALEIERRARPGGLCHAVDDAGQAQCRDEIQPVTGVMFGMVAALLWGGGDFTGGLATRRSHPLQVLVVSSAAGLALLAVFALVSRDGLPSQTSALWATAAGLSGALGIAALYRGLATGRAATVAPVAAVIGAAIPVAVGIGTVGWPALTQSLGCAVAFPGVWLVSQGTGVADRAHPSGLGFAGVAGFGIGGFLVFMALVEPGPVFSPLVVARTATLGASVLVVSVLRLRSLRPERPALACLAGCLDAGGNVFYLLATRSARLDVAAVVASMFPAVTVALACWMLSQHVSRVQWLGVALCTVAVGLLAASDVHL